MHDKTKITWVIDNIINERHTNGSFPTLAEAAKEAGHFVIETKYVPFRDSGREGLVDNPEIRQAVLGTNKVFPILLESDGPILFHGSHEFIKAGRRTPWFNEYCPVAYCREENLRFSSYASYHGLKLLSQDFIILPYQEVIDRSKRLMDFFRTDGLFIKPNEVTKAFAGRVIYYHHWDSEISSLNQIEKISAETLCVVAPSRRIHAEFRFIVADGKVITGSEYRWDGRLDIRTDVDPSCEELARQVASHIWQADTVYTCDVALEEYTDGNYRPRLIELNSFSCAGLYACDTHKIVEAVSVAACKEFYGED